MAASGEGVQTTKNWVSTGPVEVDGMAFVPDGAQLAAPSVGGLGRCHGKEPLTELNAEEVGIDSDVQGPIQLCVNTGLEIQQIEVISCSEPVWFYQEQFAKTKELNRISAGKFRNIEISRVRFVYGVPVEEEPDPGGIWVYQSEDAKQGGKYKRLKGRNRREEAKQDGSGTPGGSVASSKRGLYPMEVEEDEAHKKQRLEKSDDQQERKAHMDAGLPGQPGETQ